VAIGSLNKAGRLEQVRGYAAVQLRSGYRTDDEVFADVLEAVSDLVKDDSEAARLTDEYLRQAREEWVHDADGWPPHDDFDRLQEAFADLEAAGIVVLEAVDDHWAAHAVLVDRDDQASPPRAVAFFTHTDVWHAVEHGMLEINLWHGSGANITDSDPLLTEVLLLFEGHDLAAHFDEGRIEVNVLWHRRPTT
jgi:hypothetical protein